MVNGGVDTWMPGDILCFDDVVDLLDRWVNISIDEWMYR